MKLGVVFIIPRIEKKFVDKKGEDEAEKWFADLKKEVENIDEAARAWWWATDPLAERFESEDKRGEWTYYPGVAVLIEEAQTQR